MSGGLVAVTGANGFVGRALVENLKTRGFGVRALVRSEVADDTVVVGDIGPATEWSSALAQAEVVVHTAARVHIMNDSASDALAEYRTVNVAGTRRLAEQAAQAGVRRLILLSSIKVNGEGTQPGKYYTAYDIADPADAYGLSKWEAEQTLRAVASECGLESVIIRPPLIYGPGVKANFKSLLRIVARGIPLPLGSIRNRRSMVALDNLVDLIVACIDHPAASGQTFLVSDDDDLSTPDLIRHIAWAMGCPARLFPMPPALLMAGAALLGKYEIAQRLCGSLQVDIGRTRTLLNWTPPVSVDEGLAATVRWYLEQNDMNHS